MRSGGIFIDHQIIGDTHLRLLFGFSLVLAVSLSSSNLSHLSLFTSNLDEILSVFRELSQLFAFKSPEKSLEHVESAIGIKLESNGGKEIIISQLLNNSIKIFADILLCRKGRRNLCNSELFIQIGVRL